MILLGFPECMMYLYIMLPALEHLSKNELIRAIEKLENKNQYLVQENLLLRAKVERYAHMNFAQKRERFIDPNQATLPFELPEEEKQKIEAQTTEKISYERKKPAASKHAGRQPLPEHLPVEEVHIQPEEDTTGMVCIGTEVTDELEYKPASYFIRRYIRYKYARKDKEKVVIGALPSRVIDKGIAGPGLLASILVDKYTDHLPLYRQMQRFKRENIPIAASTLEGWVRQGLNILDILYDHLLKETKAKGYLQADETTIRVQDPNKKGKCHQGYYWVYHCPLDGTVLFDYQRGRSSGAAGHVLDGFKGYLQTDGYAAYDKIGMRKEVTHLCCWAHARREFHNALTNDKERASIALGFIQSLYKVEAEAREKNLSAEGRKELRLDRSLKIINALGKWLADEFKGGGILPKSPIGKAIIYTLDRWDQLSAYLKDGSLEIDNNLVENAIRPLALGRKNYLFAGSHDAAKRAAAIYSFFAMCRKEDVNPFLWLRHVFENIMDTKVTQLHDLYPGAFKKITNM